MLYSSYYLQKAHEKPKFSRCQLVFMLFAVNSVGSSHAYACFSQLTHANPTTPHCTLNHSLQACFLAPRL